jgi:hypothetical protein
LDASSDRNGPKSGLFLDLKLNKINYLDSMAERERFEPSHNKGVTCKFSENTPENTSRKLALFFVRNSMETCGGF